MKNQNNKAHIRHFQDKEKQAQKLYNILKKGMSRRMAATELGNTDMTYTVTQNIKDWLKDGRAQIIGCMRCERSKRWVEKVTTDKEQFNEKTTNQLKMF